MTRYRPRHLTGGFGREPRSRRAVSGAIIVAFLLTGGVASAFARADRAPAVEAASPSSSTTTRASSSSASTATTTTAPPRREATIAFAGDVLIHSPVWEAAETPAGYDFSPMLAPIAPQLTAADLAICHLEVTLARPEDKLSSYPRFRAPSALVGNLASAGFDGCSVASNHALDFGEQGVVATLDALDEAGLQHAGTARSPEEDQQSTLYEPGGIRVAQLSYAFGFNGYTRPAGKEWLVDQIDPAKILADALAAREAGAELVVVSLHWGNEYTHDVVAAQQIVADALASVPGAVDLIVGHHAHVVQPISKVGAMWVVWGMGNLLSNNAPRCCIDEATDGVVVTVTIADLVEPGAGVGVTDVAFTPTWNERDTFRVLPVAATLAAGTASGALTVDLRASFERTAGSILALGGTELRVEPDRPPPPP